MSVSSDGNTISRSKSVPERIDSGKQVLTLPVVNDYSKALFDYSQQEGEGSTLNLVKLGVRILVGAAKKAMHVVKPIDAKLCETVEGVIKSLELMTSVPHPNPTLCPLMSCSMRLLASTVMRTLAPFHQSVGFPGACRTRSQ